MKKFFAFLVLGLIWIIPVSAAENCPDNMKINGLDHTVKSYAEFWDNYYKPQEAYDFGIKIQNIIKEKDLEGLFELVEGELQSGPRKSFIKDKNFDELFSEEWVTSILSSTPDCSPVGWRGFMLDSGSIWYNVGKKDWEIFRINGAIEEEVKQSKGGWSFKEKLIQPTCFARVWMSGDNFEEYADQFKILNYEKFTNTPGEFFGKEITNFKPIKAMWDEYITIINVVNDCPHKNLEINTDKKFITMEVKDDFGKTEFGYSTIKKIDEKKCSALAPNINSKCLSSYLVNAGDFSGGSMGWDMSYGIYGLFDLEKLGPSIVPLIFFENKNEALNYVSN